MPHKKITFTVLIITTIPITLLILFLGSASVKSSNETHSTITLSPIVSTTPAVNPTPTSTPPDGYHTFWSNAIDPKVFLSGWLVGVVGIIVAAYQIRITSKSEKANAKIQKQLVDLEREKTNLQKEKTDIQRKLLELEREKEANKEAFERKKYSIKNELKKEFEAQERERQKREQETKAAQNAMLDALNLEENVKAYRRNLITDPHIAQVQIMDMRESLKVTDIYVPVQLYKQKRDQGAGLNNKEHNPNEIFKAFEQQQENLDTIDPVEIVRKYTHCVIVGDPGAGKTTLLKNLAIKSIDNQLPFLPIYLELREFANSGYHDIIDFAASIWNNRYDFPEAEALAYMKDILRKGKAILLLDALDETAVGETQKESEESYKSVLNAIDTIATRYHLSIIVVTARKAGYHQQKRLIGFTELEILNFHPKEIKLFVMKWFACYPNSTTQRNVANLNDWLDHNPRIRTFAANPLVLTLILIVYEYLDLQRLPDRRVELYELCISLLLGKWDDERGIHRKREFTLDNKQALLEVVAWHFHRRGEGYFRRNELLMVISDFMKDRNLPEQQSSRALYEISVVDNLLKEQANNWYGFLHLTLQEYFAAKYAISHHQEKILRNYRGNSWWEEVIFLYYGLHPDAELIIQEPLIFDKNLSIQDDFFHTKLLFDGRCLTERSIDSPISQRDELIASLFDTLATTPYLLTREQIAEVLVKVGGREVNQRLIDLMPDPSNLHQRFSDWRFDPSTPFVIIRTLGKHGQYPVIPDLLRLLRNTEVNKTLRYEIADALGKLRDPSVAPELLYCALPRKFPSGEIDFKRIDLFVSAKIIDTVGELGEPTVAHDMLSLLSNSQINTYLRQIIAKNLGILGEPSVARELPRLLSDPETDKDVSESIAYALGKLGDHSLTHDLLLLLLNEKIHLDVRISMVYGLGNLHGPSVSLDLLQLLSNPHLDPALRASIVNVLGELGEQSVVHDLLRLFADSEIDPIVHTLIAITLSKLGERSVISELLRLLTTPEIPLTLRASIADVLGELGESTIAFDLLRLLPGLLTDKEVVGVDAWDMGSLGTSIVCTLGKLSGGSVARDLLPFLTNDHINRMVRKRIAMALGDLGDRSVAPELLQLLADPRTDKVVAEGITDALGELGESSVVSGLLKLLTDQRIDDADILVGIAETLGKLGSAGDKSVSHALLPLLSDKKIRENQREIIANVLGQLANDETTVRRLAKLLPTSDIADDIHRTLWNVSRRARVRVLKMDKGSDKELEIVKWEDEAEP